jgi:hypothetical protein
MAKQQSRGELSFFRPFFRWLTSYSTRQVYKAASGCVGLIERSSRHKESLMPASTQSIPERAAAAFVMPPATKYAYNKRQARCLFGTLPAFYCRRAVLSPT